MHCRVVKNDFRVGFSNLMPGMPFVFVDDNMPRGVMLRCEARSYVRLENGKLYVAKTPSEISADTRPLAQRCDIVFDCMSEADYQDTVSEEEVEEAEEE